MLTGVLDLPPPEEQPPAPAPAAAPVRAAQYLAPPPDTVRPAIEKVMDPDSVSKLLPKDPAGNIDWMEALNSGIIDPRSSLSGGRTTNTDFRFGFDFFLLGPDSTFNAYFPHSAHTQWADCAQCHPRIFPVRNTPFQMSDIFQGKFCGECHGKVAFPVMTACERCHVNLSMPPNRAQPELIGNIRIPRVTADSAEAVDSTRSARSFQTQSLPLARFPHWVHRIRYRCKVCHLDIFEPRAGANRIVMKDITAGEACGKCHNGSTAFDSGFGQCQRCHVPDDQVETGGQSE